MNTFGIQRFPIDLVFVDTTKDAAVARYNSALAVFSALARYTIVINGVSLSGCVMVEDSAHFISSEFVGGKFHETYSFEFERLG